MTEAKKGKLPVVVGFDYSGRRDNFVEAEMHRNPDGTWTILSMREPAKVNPPGKPSQSQPLPS